MHEKIGSETMGVFYRFLRVLDKRLSSSLNGCADVVEPNGLSMSTMLSVEQVTPELISSIGEFSFLSVRTFDLETPTKPGSAIAPEDYTKSLNASLYRLTQMPNMIPFSVIIPASATPSFYEQWTVNNWTFMGYPFISTSATSNTSYLSNALDVINRVRNHPQFMGVSLWKMSNVERGLKPQNPLASEQIRHYLSENL